ncbi:MAG: sensor histidine kinase [Planctomycetota bacterium]|jgi:signal transduction histidine kinase
MKSEILLPKEASNMPTFSIFIIGCGKEENVYFKHLIDSSNNKNKRYVVYTEDDIIFDPPDNTSSLILLKLENSNDSISRLNTCRKIHPMVPIIVFTDTNDSKVGLEAINNGAQDYLVKEVINVYSLNRAIRYALGRSRIEQSLYENISAMEDFAHTAAHDLKSPLVIIRSYIKYIKDELDNIPIADLQNYFDTIEGSSNKMQKLINDLLNYAKANHNVDSFKLINLNEIINNISAVLDINGNIVVKELPEVYGSKSLLHQMFINLIQNSVNYKKEDVQLNISVSSMINPTSPEYVDILVKDNGIGIREENLTEIFKPFKRFTKINPGSGIGLANCKKIAMSHKGSISVVSKIGEGTVFKVSLLVTKPTNKKDNKHFSRQTLMLNRIP